MRIVNLTLLTILITLFSLNLNSQMNFSWANDMSGSSDSQTWDVKMDGGCNVYQIGEFSGSIAVDNSGNYNFVSSGSSDIFFVKYSVQGNVIFARQFGTSGMDRGYALSIDSQDNVYIVGKFSGTINFDPLNSPQGQVTSSGNLDGIIVKYDSNGNFLWCRKIGGSSLDRVLHIQVDNNDDIVITGAISTVCSFDNGVGGVVQKVSNGLMDVFYAKYLSTGVLQFVHSFGAGGNDTGMGINVDNQNNIIITGYFSGTINCDPAGTAAGVFTQTSGTDVFIAKYTPNGDYLWGKQIYGTYHNWGFDVAVDSNDKVYVSGRFESTSITLLPDNIFLGSGASGNNGYMVVFDSNGTLTDRLIINGTGGNGLRLMNIDQSNRLFVAGFKTAAASVFHNSNSVSMTWPSFGGNDILVLELDINNIGNVIETTIIGGSGQDRGNSVHMKNGVIAIGGYFQSTVDFDPSSSTASLTSVGSANTAFIALYNSISSPHDITINDTDCNNSNGTISIDFENGQGDTEIYLNGVLQITNPIANLQSGEYTLSIVPESGCPFDTLVFINISNISDAPLVDTPVEYCVGDTPLSLDVTPNDGGTINWYGTDVTNIPSQIAPTPSTDVPGSTYYYVSQTIDGCESLIDSILVIVHPFPEIDAGMDLQVCVGDSVILSAINPSGAAISWSNDVVDGESFLPDGNSDYYIVSGELNGCISSDSLIIQILDLPEVSFSANISEECDMFITSLTNTSPFVGVNCSWVIDGVVVDNNCSEYLHVFYENGQYVVSFISADSNGCENQYDTTFVLNFVEIPLPQIEPLIEYCVGDEPQPLAASPSDEGVINWYGTSPTNTPTQIAPIPNTDIGGSNYYYLSQTIDDCESYLDSILVAVSEPPYFVLSDSSLCDGLYLTLSASEFQQNESYEWSTGQNGTSISVSQTGIYSVTVTNDCGVYTDSAYIDFVNCNVTIPNIFTPNGDGINDFFQLPDFIGFHDFSIIIFNRWGNIICQFNDSDFQWDGKDQLGKEMLEGVYFYKVLATDLLGNKIDVHGFVHLLRE